MNNTTRTRTLFSQININKTILSCVLSVLIGLFTGALIIILIGLFNDKITLKTTFEGLKLIILGIFSTGRNQAGELTFGFNPVNIGNLLFKATPVIMTGLSVAVAFKSGLFNIGAPGQYLFGTAACLFLSLSLPSDKIHPLIIWCLAFLGSCLAGAVWGAIPGILKSVFNINEVLSCIMTNWIAANLVTAFFRNSPLRNSAQSGKIGYIMPSIENGVATPKLGLDIIFEGSQVNAGIIVAVLFAFLLYFIITRTTVGYELKTCGANKYAAHYAGMKYKLNTVIAMAVAGALSAAGAALYYLSGNTEFFWSAYQSLPAEGFNGIPVALLAANNPLSIIFTGLFMSGLSIAGQQLKTLTAFNEHIADIIIAVIVYLSAFSLLIKNLLSTRKTSLKTVPDTSEENTDSNKEILSELSEKNYDTEPSEGE